MIKGTPVSTGVAHGTAYVLACAHRTAGPRRTIAAEEVDRELERFETARAASEKDLLALKATVSEKIGASEADIFAAQALLLADPALRNQVSALVRDKRVNAEAAVAEVVEKFTRAFDEISDAYLRERAVDVRDVGRRVLAALIEERAPETLNIPAGSIVVAEELLPSVTARLEVGRARAFVTERGGKFSHTSILARSLGTPAVVGVDRGVDAHQDRRPADRRRLHRRGVHRPGRVGAARVRPARGRDPRPQAVAAPPGRPAGGHARRHGDRPCSPT